MELAIPLIALGSMYIISNQDKKNEKFSNMFKNTNTLPNVEQIPVNYPITSNVSSNNTKLYSNPNQTTDKFFEPSHVYNNLDLQNKQNKLSQSNFTSMSGQNISSTNFKHNNMTPYFGSKIRGATIDANISEGILDNMQGTGTQQFRKKEITPLFKPQDNVQWANGMPNQTDFYQSRVNPSLKMANVKPWEEQHVGPGLNKGYTTSGSNGFNAGMESRDTWLPKTVDELRVDTNPKETYGLDGHQGPSVRLVQNRGVMGKVEKYLPDTYYNNTPDRWLTTTGIEKAQTARGTEILHDVSRPETSKEYYGSRTTAEGEAGYAPQNYHPSTRTESKTSDNMVVSAVGKNTATSGDYGNGSYTFLPTNRSTMQCEDRGSVGGVIKSVIAPILDIFRQTRKEEIINNMRPYENIRSNVPAGSVFNPADRTKTTNREMQEGNLDNNHLNLQNQKNDAYLISEQNKINNNRDSTNTSYIGNSGGAGSHSGPMDYESGYNQRNNPNKTYINRPNQGGTQVFNQYDNIKIDKRDNDRDNNRLWVRSSGPSVSSMDTPYVQHIGEPTILQQQYNENINCERIQPDILTAFKQNPYTQSLHSCA